jgi:phospholipid transport system substrate-binding protein
MGRTSYLHSSHLLHRPRSLALSVFNISHALWSVVWVSAAAVCLNVAVAQNKDPNTPDGLIERITSDVMRSVKNDAALQQGDIRQITQLVNEKILPYADIQKTTRLAVGHHWRQATSVQQQQLIKQFKDLLFYTYAGAISQVRHQQIRFLPFDAPSAATDVVVKTQMVGGDQPIALDYRLTKTPPGWRVYDISIEGAWLIQTYRGQFNEKISTMGIDGLIKDLAKQNQRLASGKKAS